MIQYYSVDMTGGGSKKLDEEPTAADWHEETTFLKLENNDLYEMEEDGEWRLIG